LGERDRVDEGEAVAGELLKERDGGGVGEGAEEDVGALVGLGVEVEVFWLGLAPCIKYSLGPRVMWGAVFPYRGFCVQHRRPSRLRRLRSRRRARGC
jgi:hypothetical protein